MKSFSYFDYIKCIHTLRLNAVLQMAEETEEYNLEIKDEKQTIDYKIKEVLKTKEEAEKFINNFLRPYKEVNKDEIKVDTYSPDYVSNIYKKKEQIIYIINNSLIFYISIESKINRATNYKMLNSCINLMRIWIKKDKKTMKYPIIIPVLIYTGKQTKSEIKLKIEDQYIDAFLSEKSIKKVQYNIININLYSNKFLENINSKFANVILERNNNKT